MDMKREKSIPTIERRVVSTEFRLIEKNNGKQKIEGYSAVFDKWSETLGWFREKIEKGAFTRALKTSDARALFNHDSNLILGREVSKTLKLSQDDSGLYMELDPPNTTYANDLLESIRRGDVREQSFGFTISSDTWEDEEKPIASRTINIVNRLYDVSPVTFPAYPDTDIAMRSFENFKKTVNRDRENKDKRVQILKMQSQLSEII